MEFMKALFVISDRLIRTLIVPLVGSSWNELNYCGQLIVLELFWIVIGMISLSTLDGLVMPIWPDFMSFSSDKKIFGEGSHHIGWGYWNWLMLTKRLLNQLPSANIIHSILGSLYFGDVAYSNLWRQYLIWSINLANIIVTTLHSQTKHHQTIMLGSCNISDCMASIASCTHLTNVHWLFRPWFEILGTTMAVRAEKAEER